MLSKEICSQIHTKHIHTQFGQNVELLNVKLAVHLVTTGLSRVRFVKHNYQRSKAPAIYIYIYTLYIA
jgi:hypothetical protein